jgi:hypothetical protein
MSYSTRSSGTVADGTTPPLRINVRQISDDLADPTDDVGWIYAVHFDVDDRDLSDPKRASMALDIFHAHWGIGCLDDFEIDVIDADAFVVEQDGDHHDYSSSDNGSVEKISDDPVPKERLKRPAGHGSATPPAPRSENTALLSADGLSMTLQLRVSTRLQATPAELLKAVEALLDSGMVEAVATLENKEVDQSAARFATSLEIGRPAQVGTNRAPATSAPVKPLPEDPGELNDDRALRAQAALAIFQGGTGCDQGDGVANLLSALIQHCDRNGLVFDDELRRARNHCEGDTFEDPSLMHANAPRGG